MLLLISSSQALPDLPPRLLLSCVARLPCLLPSPRACSHSCPLSQWCHPAISSSVSPFSCLKSFPASGSFPGSQFFASGGQSIGASASVSVLPVNIQCLFPLRRAWKTTPVFLTGEFHWHKSLVGYSPWDCRVRHDWVTNGISFRIDWFDLLAVKDSQESFPTLQFKNISSFVLSLLFGSILTSIHDY